MFYITSKDKIISVIIALSTVIVLFLLASSLKVKNTKAMETKANTTKTIINVNKENNNY